MSTTSDTIKQTKKKKPRLAGKRKELYESLKEQLEINDNYNNYTEDLLQDYLTMYDTKCMLAQDIRERGVSIEYDNGGGQKGSRNNPSIDLYNRTNAQMIKLLDALGLKPSKMSKPQYDGDDDDEL